MGKYRLNRSHQYNNPPHNTNNIKKERVGFWRCVRACVRACRVISWAGPALENRCHVDCAEMKELGTLWREISAV